MQFGYSGFDYFKVIKHWKFQRILIPFLRNHPNLDWPRALPMVQVMKNRRFLRGIGRSPFEAMFGRELQMGNEDGNLPSREERGLPPNDDEDTAFPSLCLSREEVFTY